MSYYFPYGTKAELKWHVYTRAEDSRWCEIAADVSDTQYRYTGTDIGGIELDISVPGNGELEKMLTGLSLPGNTLTGTVSEWGWEVELQN